MTTDNPAADLQLSLSRDALTRQNDDIRLLGTKATVLFAACLALSASEVVSHFLPLVALAGSSLLAILALWPSSYRDGPKLDRSDEILREHTYQDSLNWLATAFRMATEHNSSVMGRKAIMVASSATLLSLAIFLQLFIRLS